MIFVHRNAYQKKNPPRSPPTIKVEQQQICLTKKSFSSEKNPKKTNMTMENPPFEDVFHIEHGNFPMSCYHLVN